MSLTLSNADDLQGPRHAGSGEGTSRSVLVHRRDSPEAAGRWAKGARRSIKALRRFPLRCPIAPESREFNYDIRELRYGSGNRGTYRILFTILEKTIFVLHVRHGSMQMLLNN
jgi:plasmid stabilization system protein ParE